MTFSSPLPQLQLTLLPEMLLVGLGNSETQCKFYIVLLYKNGS